MVLQDVGVIAASEPPAASDLQDAMRKLNFMLNAWSVRSLMVLGAIMEGFGLTAGKGQYSIGIGGDFNTTKPSAISSAFLRDGVNEDSGIILLTQTQWFAITDKDISTGRPTAIYYDQGITQAANQMGIVNIYTMPDASTPYTLFIGEQKPLTEFSNLTDVVTFQPAYYEALEYNLAIRLWRSYHEDDKPIPADVVMLARETMQVIETMNAKQVTATIEAPGKARPYNIIEGGAA
jgi:hypothetical protein